MDQHTSLSEMSAMDQHTSLSEMSAMDPKHFS